jgi:hypothetical protein
VLVLSGAGVGGGSHIYANTLYVPPKKFFDAPGWAGITDWADELAPCVIKPAGCSVWLATRTCRTRCCSAARNAAGSPRPDAAEVRIVSFNSRAAEVDA